MNINTYHTPIITLFALLLQNCAKEAIQIKGLRTGLMGNSDYLDLNGKSHRLSLNDEILIKIKTKLSKISL